MNIQDIDSEKVLSAVKEEAIERVNAANALRFTINTEGWEIIKGSFQSIEDDALDQLGEQLPGDDKNILAAHAVWYSVRNAYKNVRQAIAAAIEDGDSAAMTLKELRNESLEDE